MTKSANSFPQRLTEYEPLLHPEQSYLGADDSCLFFGEYTARRGYDYGPTNNLIFNFKKSIEHRGKAQWRYKESAIKEVAEAFRGALNVKWLETATLVPMPPSKAKTDPLYDDRVLRMIRLIRPDMQLDIRELVVQPQNRAAAQHDGQRLTPQELEQLYAIEAAAANIAPIPRHIGLFDDLVVTGAGFKAAKARLQQRFPGVKVLLQWLRSVADGARVSGDSRIK
jgi:predicted amidophosphoribosyltransferase